MKNYILSLFCIVLATACTPKQPAQTAPQFVGNVRVLAYSSIGSDGGFLKSVKDQFQTATKCELKIETTLGAAQLVTHLKEHPGTVDFVVGIDEVMFERGKEFFDAASLDEVAKKIQWNKKIAERLPKGFYPLDYGSLTLIYHKPKMEELKLPVPQSVQDLLKPIYKKKFIVQDPRVSSPGMYFFSWLPKSIDLKKISTQWLALAQGWDASYQMFMQGEAPMVWSYLSSIAYHESKGKGAEYGFVDFKEGLPLQVEGMTLVANAQKSECIKKWFEFIFTTENQSILAEKQWMLPAVEGAKVPSGFASIASFQHFSKAKPNLKELDDLLSRFSKEVQGDRW